MTKSLRFLLLTLVLMIATVAAAQKGSAADGIVAAAVAKAAQEHKIVFLDFGATWCGNCHLLDSYLAAPEIKPIIDKYFVIADLNVQEEAGKHPERNTPGGEKLYKAMGGGDDGGVPFFVFLDEKGKKIVDSAAPKTGNVGYPVAPEEIDWFMVMVKKAVPSMTKQELKTLEGTLRERAKQLQ